MKYRTLFFDLDNTLYDFDQNSKVAMKQAFDELRILEQLPSFDTYFEVYLEINDHLWGQYREGKISKEKLKGRRFELALNEFDIQWANGYSEIDNFYLSKMADQKELYDDTIDVLSFFQRLGCKMHIITNGFAEVQYKKMTNTGLDQWIDRLFISEELKCQKPSREIFEHAFKNTNSRKRESIMIGDSWESDIIGAKTFGIDQVYFNPKQNKTEFGDWGAPTYEIQTLSELKSIIG